VLRGRRHERCAGEQMACAACDHAQSCDTAFEFQICGLEETRIRCLRNVVRKCSPRSFPRHRGPCPAASLWRQGRPRLDTVDDGLAKAGRPVRQPDDAAYARPRSLHESHHSWVLPTKQTCGRAKAREALLDFSSGSHAVVRKRHEAVSVAELAVAFWALAKGLQLVGDDEVFGFQRVKHHSLRED
jgi:hypothetical protein